MKKIQIKTFNSDKLKIKKISDKKFNALENIFKKLRKKSRENKIKFEQEPVYINYFGDIISLQEANKRFSKARENLTKKTKNSIRS